MAKFITDTYKGHIHDDDVINVNKVHRFRVNRATKRHSLYECRYIMMNHCKLRNGTGTYVYPPLRYYNSNEDAAVYDIFNVMHWNKNSINNWNNNNKLRLIDCISNIYTKNFSLMNYCRNNNVITLYNYAKHTRSISEYSKTRVNRGFIE